MDAKKRKTVIKHMGFTVLSNERLRSKELSLKSTKLLNTILSLQEVEDNSVSNQDKSDKIRRK